MKKLALIFLLIPMVLAGCTGNTEDKNVSNQNGVSMYGSVHAVNVMH